MDQRTRSTRAGLAASVAMAIGVVTTGSAAAAPPSRVYSPLPPVILDDSCGYTIEVTFPTDREYVTTFLDRDGNVRRIAITGALVVTFTNPETGKSLTANISGPSHIDIAHGTNTGEGNWALWPDGSLSLLAGRTDFDTGVFHGRVKLSVCDALAP